MPAGIQAMKLEELERRLRTDIMQEAIAWAGRVMLHKEVCLDTPAARQVEFDQAAAPSKHVATFCGTSVCMEAMLHVHQTLLSVTTIGQSCCAP